MAEKKLNGLEKAAVLLHSLPATVVEKVLKQMDARQAGLLRAELSKANARGDIKAILTEVINEADGVISSTEPTANAGPTKIASAPAAKGPASLDIRLAADTVEKPAPIETNAEMEKDPLGAIATMPADLVAQALESENTRTISLLINYLDIEVAGAVYKRLTPVKRKEVSMRFPEQATVSDELVCRIAQAVLRKCQSLRSASSGATEGGAREKRMASLLRGLERTERAEMITVLEQADAELAGRVKSMLYLFEDILRMQNISVQKLLTETDTKTLAMALFDAPADIRDKLLANLSKRAQEALHEEIELTGKVPSAKVNQARQSIADAIQRLDQRGDLVLIE